MKEETDGDTNATMTITKSACGPWTGLSNHTMWDPYVEVQLNRETTLNAGQCGGSCEEACNGDPACECGCIGGEWMPAEEGGEPFCSGGTPILISLDQKSKYKLTSPNEGVQFDLDGDGFPEQVAWTHPFSEVAFLALDRDGDGRITSGKELFGNHTLPGAKNGFAALSMTAMAANGGVMRGSVDSDEPVFFRLLLWTDENHNGISEPWELRPASQALAAIGLGYEPSDLEDQFGNKFLFRGWARLRTAPGKNSSKSPKEDEERGLRIWDVSFKILRRLP